MYLKHIRARNYRAFGDGTSEPALGWALNPGLNILVGENDAGKTGIVDGIRQVLLTTSYEPVRLFEQDFHIQGANRAHTLSIEAALCGLSPDQESLCPGVADPWEGWHLLAHPSSRGALPPATGDEAGPGRHHRADRSQWHRPRG